jgi:hypothetical protein
VRYSYTKTHRFPAKVVPDPSDPVEKKTVVSRDGSMKLSMGLFYTMEINLDGGPYFGGHITLSVRPFGDDEPKTLSGELRKHYLAELERGVVVPMPDGSGRIAFVVREIKEWPNTIYLDGDPDWVPKGFLIENFKGEAKLDATLIDSTQNKAVRAPVDGVYRLRMRGAQHGGAQLCVKKGAPLGFDLSTKGRIRDVCGKEKWSDWKDDGVVWEWYLETVRPEGIPAKQPERAK